MRTGRWRLIGAVPAVVIVGGLALASLTGVVFRSLRPGTLLGGDLGLAAWKNVLADGGFWKALLFTLQTTAMATILALVIAVPLGIALRHSGRVARALMIILLPVPHLVVASATVSWLGPGQLLDRLLIDLPVVGNRFGLGVVLVYLVKEVPFLVVLVAAALDDATLEREQAAASLGASLWQRWRFVVLPRLAAPLSLGALVVAAFVIGSTEVALVVGPLRPETLSTHALALTRIRGPVARADAAVVLVVASVLVLSLGGIGVWLAERRGRRLAPGRS